MQELAEASALRPPPLRLPPPSWANPDRASDCPPEAGMPADSLAGRAPARRLPRSACGPGQGPAAAGNPLASRFRFLERGAGFPRPEFGRNRRGPLPRGPGARTHFTLPSGVPEPPSLGASVGGLWAWLGREASSRAPGAPGGPDRKSYAPPRPWGRPGSNAQVTGVGVGWRGPSHASPDACPITPTPPRPGLWHGGSFRTPAWAGLGVLAPASFSRWGSRI